MRVGMLIIFIVALVSTIFHTSVYGAKELSDRFSHLHERILKIDRYPHQAGTVQNEVNPLKNFEQNDYVATVQNMDTLSQMERYIHDAKLALEADQTGKALTLLRRVKKNQERLQEGMDFDVFYQTFANVWKQRGRLDSALYYTEKLITLKEDSIVRQRQQYLLEMRVKYKAEQDERELVQLKNKMLKNELDRKTRQIQLNTLMGSSFTLVLIIILLIWFFSFKHKKNKKIREQEVAFLRKEREVTVAQSLLVGEENERKRIARELHDGLGVLLSSASMFFSNLEEDVEPEKQDTLQKARELVDKANTEIRRISQNMRPVVLARFGLKAALEDLSDKVSSDFSVQLNVSLEKTLSEIMEVTLYRLTQELLNNTLKHAQATKVKISCFVEGNVAHLHYQDDGKGFDMKEEERSKGIGLLAMRNRVEFLKGNIDFQSAPEQGMSVKITLPLQRSEL